MSANEARRTERTPCSGRGIANLHEEANRDRAYGTEALTLYTESVFKCQCTARSATLSASPSMCAERVPHDAVLPAPFVGHVIANLPQLREERHVRAFDQAIHVAAFE